MMCLDYPKDGPEKKWSGKMECHVERLMYTITGLLNWLCKFSTRIILSLYLTDKFELELVDSFEITQIRYQTLSIRLLY